MGPFILDLVLGILFILSISMLILGCLIFRYRRDTGPLILIVSGISGITASMLGVLSRSGVLDLPDWSIILLYAISILLLIISFIFWRTRK